MHVVDPIVEYVPVSHSTQPVVLSMSVSARPEGQDMHVLVAKVTTGALQYVPGRQAVQGVAEFESPSTCPGTHASQDVSLHPA